MYFSSACGENTRSKTFSCFREVNIMNEKNQQKNENQKNNQQKDSQQKNNEKNNQQNN